MKLRISLLLIICALLGAGGYYLLSRSAQAGENLSGQAPTALVRQDELLVNVSGSGELSAVEIPLAFSIPGVIDELDLEIGDVVQAGQILARLDDRQAALDLKSAQVQWDSQVAARSVAEADQQRLELQQELAEAQEERDFLRDGPPSWYFEIQLDRALAEYADARQAYVQALNLVGIDAKKYKPLLKKTQRQADRALTALEAAQADLEWAKNYRPDAHELALAEAQAALVAARLAAQETLLEVLRGGALPLAGATTNQNQALLSLAKANLAVSQARWTLEQASLVAPMAGVVSGVFAAPGESVAGEAVLTLSVMDPLQIRFYLEETDLAQVWDANRLENRLEIRLDAYPDQVFQGRLVRIDPALVMVDGTLMAQAWGEFTAQPEVALFPGMSLEVEVITGSQSADEVKKE